MVKNILVIRNDRFGEFLLNIPAICALKEMYPQSSLSVAVSSAVCELAGVVECVDKVLVWDEIKGNLRKYKFDLAVVFNPTKEAHQSIFLAGIPVRVGYNRKWGFLLTHKIKDTKHLGNRHEVDCNLELVELLKTSKKLIVSSGLRLANNDKYEFLFNAIAIHPFTSDPVKQWPVERFSELAQRIKRELGLRVVMVGKDKEIASALVAPRNDGIDDGIINMINKTSLVELAVLLKRCSLLISGDSGPMHLAAAVGTPVVALFRNDLPGKTARRWGPWGSSGHTVIEKSNLDDIAVSEVFNKVKEALNR